MTYCARPASGFKCNYNRKGIRDVDDREALVEIGKILDDWINKDILAYWAMNRISKVIGAIKE